MTTMADVQTKIQGIKESVAAEKQEVQAKITTIAGEVQRLTVLLAGGGMVTSADLDVLMKDLEAIGAGVQDISEPVVEVPAGSTETPAAPAEPQVVDEP